MKDRCDVKVIERTALEFSHGDGEYSQRTLLINTSTIPALNPSLSSRAWEVGPISIKLSIHHPSHLTTTLVSRPQTLGRLLYESAFPFRDLKQKLQQTGFSGLACVEGG